MSSSRYKTGGYLEHADPQFAALYGQKKYEILLIPYAGVTSTFDQVEEKAKAAFERNGHTLKSIHHFNDPKAAVAQAEAIAIAGGNTFVLLKRLIEAGIVEPIRQRVLAGVPYVGWSAGGNICNPTIRTTNDMPIAFPGSFDALNLIPFQTNPHFISGKMPGHNGESREDRLNEFLAYNATEEVVGMPEGTSLLVEGAYATVLGESPMLWFRQNKAVESIQPGTKFALDSIKP
jgi:dipeptidase E